MNYGANNDYKYNAGRNAGGNGGAGAGGGEGGNRNGRNVVLLIVGVLLVVAGVYKLCERLLAPWWDEIARFIATITNIAWPLVIIAIGVFFIAAVKRGSFSGVSGKKLYRSRTNRKLGGVCGGIAEYLGAEAAVVRIVALVVLVVSCFTVTALYLILWLVIPEQPL